MAIKKYQILFLPVSRRDLLDIAAYIAADSPVRALAYINKIHSRIKNLAKHPKMGFLTKDQLLKNKGYRVLVIDSYLVFYVVQGRYIKIRRILHASRDLNAILF